VEGQGYDEIGQRFGMSEPAVRSILTRARKALRKEYASRGGTLPVAGLSALLVTSATMFSIVRVLGAAYLIVLGAQMVVRRQASGERDDRDHGDEATTTPGRSARRLYLDGVVVKTVVRIGHAAHDTAEKSFRVADVLRNFIGNHVFRNLRQRSVGQGVNRDLMLRAFVERQRFVQTHPAGLFFRRCETSGVDVEGRFDAVLVQNRDKADVLADIVIIAQRQRFVFSCGETHSSKIPHVFYFLFHSKIFILTLDNR
jgi:hypothetical protein